MSRLQALEASSGLTLNLSKCELVGPAEAEFLPEITIRHDWSRFELLGAPCGSSEVARREYLDARVRSAIRKLSLFSVVARQDPHAGLAVTRYCGGFALLCFYMRLCGSSPSLVEHDEALVSEVLEHLSVSMTTTGAFQASLPIRFGGLGLRPTAPFAAAAAVASAIAALPLAKLFTSATLPVDQFLQAHLLALPPPALAVAACIQQEFVKAMEENKSPVGRLIQKRISAPIDESFKNALAEAAGPRDLARVSSATAPGGSLWLSLPAMGCRELWLEPVVFRHAVALRLGLPVAPGPYTCVFCDGSADPLGDHALTCMHGGHRTLLHHQIVSTIVSFASAGLMHPQREVTLPRTSNQRMDIVLRSGFRKTQLIDVAVTHPLTADHIPKAIAAPAGAATAYEARKIATYANSYDKAVEQLVPCIVDTFGGWGDAARPLLNKIASAVGRRSATPKIARAQFWCSLNATVVGGVAQLVAKSAGLVGTLSVPIVAQPPPLQQIA